MKLLILSEKECGLWLNNIKGIGYKKIQYLIEYFGDYKSVYYATEKELCKIKSLSEKNIFNILESKDVYCIKTNLENMESKGYKFVLRYEQNYPKRLKDIYAPPHILYYRGELPKEEVPSIAIIGARECTSYGMHYATKFAYELASKGFQIISGLARGIDTAAHLGAIESKVGKTFGVLGCGVDVCYPKSNIDTFMQTINHGGIISECPIGAIPVAGNFPMRNRIISGLCDGILVIEARKQSGSLITVDLALEQGKDVYALPGAINSLLSEGCNNIIKIGAKSVTKVEDILEDYSNYLYRRNSVNYITNESNKSDKMSLLNDEKINDDLDDDLDEFLEKNKIYLERHEKIVYASLRLESKHIDSIVYETGFSIGEVIKILFDLEEKKLVIQTQNNYYTRLNLG